jgi:hypothetical protein
MLRGLGCSACAAAARRARLHQLREELPARPSAAAVEAAVLGDAALGDTQVALLAALQAAATAAAGPALCTTSLAVLEADLASGRYACVPRPDAPAAHMRDLLAGCHEGGE